MYNKTYQLSDSIYKKDARTQINELNTLFHVNELNMERRLQKGRTFIIIFALIAVTLAVFLGFGIWMNRRLHRKNEELADARDQAQEALRMKSEFIKNISHEIRTPLNILSGFSQIMSVQGAQLPEKERLELSNNIQENTNRITLLINRLLELSDANSRSHIERTDSISANLMCQTAIASSGVADNKQHQFHFDTTLVDDFTITTSEHFAVQAIDHLLDNAMKFTPEGGSITMRCSQQANVLSICIEDTGCGVPKEKADTIFEEFVQLDDFQDGVGIGLPLSRSIVRRLGGDIILDTTYLSGARFILTLPL
jgi:signal transduction histidine kinase